MLPWLRNKQVKSSGITMAVRKPEGGVEEAPEPEAKENYGLKSCADALIKAIESKDSDAVAQALQDAFDVMESQPQEADSGDME